MSTIDARIAELEEQFAKIQKELDLLKAQSGQVQEFIKLAEMDGSLPGAFSATDVASLIDLWEKFKGGK